MPAIGARGGIQRGASLPGARTPNPPVSAQPTGLLGGIGAAVGNIGGAVHHATVSASTPHRGVVQAGTDVQTGGYNFARANAYKQTPAYHNAVAQVFQAQPMQQRAAIIQGLVRNNAFNTQEYHAIRSVWDHLPTSEMSATASLIPHDIAKFISPHTGSLGSLVSSGLGDVGHLVDLLPSRNNGTPIGQAEQQTAAGMVPADLVKVPVHAAIDVARAGVEKPAVVPATLKGLGETAIGAIPGLIEAAQHPAKTVQALANDVSQRYGPLVQGNDRAFINRIKNSPQGAAPEVVDALSYLGGADATIGRAVTGMGKARAAFTGSENFLTRTRPGLRVEANVTRPQALAKGAMKITAQRAEDRIRAALAGRGELHPRPGEVTPIFGGHAQRVGVSATAARTRVLMQRRLNREIRMGSGSAQGAMARLNKWERKAFTVVVEGHVPLRSGAQAAKDWIDHRIAQITEHRLANHDSFGNLMPPQHAAQIDELRILHDLRDNVSKWLTPKLAATVDREGQRAIRVGQMNAEVHALNPVTEEARRLRPQGEALGIEHPHDRIARVVAMRQQRLGELQTEVKQLMAGERPARATHDWPSTPAAVLDRVRRSQAEIAKLHQGIEGVQSPGMERMLLAQYSKKVRAGAEKAGLPAEPGFFHHQPHPKSDFGAYTSGQGHATMPGVKRSTFALYKGGAMDRSVEAYIDGLAHSIKRPHQWRLVDEQFRRASVQPTPEAIKAALGKDKSVNDLTGFELQRALQHDKIDLRNVRFYQPGRLKAATFKDAEAGRLAPDATIQARESPTMLGESAQLHGHLNQNDIVQPGTTTDHAFLSGAGVRALPTTAFDEIHSSLHPSGKVGRLWGKAQGLTAAAILGGSPSFVIMNTLAEGLVAAFGTRGKLLKEMMQYPMWMRQFDKADRIRLHDQIAAYSGARGRFRTEKLGSTAQSDIARSWRDLQNRGIMRAVRSANPVRILFDSQEAASTFLRETTMFSELKHQALASMGENMNLATQAFERAQNALRLHPTGKLDEALRAQVSSLPALEEAGRHVNEMIGDYTRFTSTERRYLNNRAILFYPFLRFATKTLLYTLPLHHPLATGLVGELAKLHNDEVRKLLGGVDLPWAYSRLFFKGKNGKLSSIDTLRSSPVGSTLTDLSTQGVQGLASTITPEVAPLLDMIYGHTASGAAMPRNVFAMFNAYGSMSYPYRAFAQSHFGLKAQQADSIPFIHERPVNPKTAAAQEYQAAKEKANAPLDQRMLGQLLGIVPKPDNSQVVAAHMAAKAASGGRSSSGGGGGFLGGGGGGGSGSGGGGFLGS